MTNMSYCRFENTLADLEDCYEALDDKGLDDLSETEKECAIRLIRICGRIWDDYEREVEKK